MRHIAIMRGTLLLGFMLVAGSLTGCNDQVTTLTGFVCASCTNIDGVITNLGPTASVEACQEFGAEYQCAGAELLREGECGGTIDTNASRIVAECLDDPSDGCPSE